MDTLYLWEYCFYIETWIIICDLFESAAAVSNCLLIIKKNLYCQKCSFLFEAGLNDFRFSFEKMSKCKWLMDLFRSHRRYITKTLMNHNLYMRKYVIRWNSYKEIHSISKPTYKILTFKFTSVAIYIKKFCIDVLTHFICSTARPFYPPFSFYHFQHDFHLFTHKIVLRIFFIVQHWCRL